MPGGLVPCVARITVNGERCLDIFNSSCGAPSKANMHSCVRIISLSVKRVHTVRGVRRGANIITCGLKANRNCDILSVIGTFSGTYKDRITCGVTPEHTKSVTRYCTGPTGTGTRLGFRTGEGLSSVYHSD